MMLIVGIGGVDGEDRSVGEPSDGVDHVLGLHFGARIGGDLGKDRVVVRARDEADGIPDMGMVRQRAAAAAGLAGTQRDAPAVAELRVALPGPPPDGIVRVVDHVDGQQLTQCALREHVADAVQRGVVAHLQLHLANDAGLFGDLHHLPVLVHVEGRDLHGEDVQTAAGSLPHLTHMAEVVAADDDRFDLGMGVVELLVRCVLGHVGDGLHTRDVLIPLGQ